MMTLIAALALIPLTLNASAPGMEILYPATTLLLGGLVNSALLHIIVTLIVFKRFGEKALKMYAGSQ
jgi:HME family heavy-metal exporter